ncbi:MAG: gamma-glutamyltransferase [Gemmatimonadota bacterium]|nr:MAG: gamma-glutamyltransferase [Gemmatimonadota bacterium]
MVEKKSTGGMRNFDSPTPDVFPPPESMRPTLVGEHYMISAGHPLVAHIAAQVLERGGSAIDAGVAGGIACNVIQVDMANFGGVAPILVRQAGSDEVWSISGVGSWGRKVSLETFVERFGDDMPLGAPVAVVPAAPDAWIAALRRFGSWSFAEVAAPSIAYARDGFPLDFRTATALEIFGSGFGDWESSRRVYWPENRPPVTGERLCQPDLAALLETMAAAERGVNRDEALENVRQAFYRGEVAEQIVRFNQQGGGWLTLEDLAEFRCEVAPAPYVDYHGYRVHTTGPYSQGPAMLQALAILAGFDLSAMEHNSAAYLHTLAESLKLAFSDRERYYGDPNFVEVDLEHLLSKEHADDLRSYIRADAALPDLPTVTGPARKRFDTTYLCVIDRDGNAFSAMPSDTLDGGPIVPGLGIITSPRGVQSRLDSKHPSAIAPGKRPRLTPSPAIAVRPGEGADAMVMPFGCPGGDVILQAMLQAFLNTVHFEMLPQQAVEAPRVAAFSFPDSFYPHVHIPGRLSVERRIPERVRADLEARGHKIHLWPEYEFDAGGVSLAGDLKPPSASGRVLAAGADPRRVNYAWGK